MDRTAVATEIRSFLAQESNLPDSLLGDDTDLFGEGILDSLMAVSLIAFCEEKFGCRLNGADFSEQDMRTIASLAKIIADTRNGSGV
jgi:acyl carrier protein